jgi:GDP-mannose 6-dehydrogenase
MRISIFGLGYVGAVSSACLANLGHQVIGCDLSVAKVDMVNAGRSPIVEERIDELMDAMVKAGRVRATTDLEEAVRNSDVSLIAVGTPTAANGEPDLAAVEAVVRQIGVTLKALAKSHVVVLRSTVPPGTMEGLVKPTLEAALGVPLGDKVHAVFNPEFLREGRSVRDFEQPPFTIVGADTDAGFQAVADIYKDLPAETIRTDWPIAESIKLLSNAYHALKIGFANEAGALLKSVGSDSRLAMELFCRDTQLNVSAAYLRPGFAFGGSCLPKDLRALLTMARKSNIELPMLSAVLPSNQAHINRALKLIMDHGRGKVAMFGLAFKPGTDDLRESPLVTLAERLLGKGYWLTIVDRLVDASRLMGKNKAYIEHEIPHFTKLLSDDAGKTAAEADIIVVGHVNAEDLQAILANYRGQLIVDLSGVKALEGLANYQGICW